MTTLIVAGLAVLVAAFVLGFIRDCRRASREQHRRELKTWRI